jgi:uncharacterized protein YuzE
MKIHYYNETDSLYIELSPKPSTESKEVARGLVVDFDDSGNVVGFDIDHASTISDLDQLETVSLPTKSTKQK